MSDKKMFFSVTEGVLTLEFEGTEDELRADFAKKVADFVAALEKQIAKFEEDKEKIKAPTNMAEMSKERQTAIEFEIRAKIAAKDAEIATARRQIEKAKEMSIGDVQYFVLTPIKLA